MTATPAEPLRISGRLRDALVADLVLEDLSSDYWVTTRLHEEWEWTEHLGRQLGLNMAGPGGLHETLLLMIPEIDDRLRGSWPPQQDIAWCRALAHEATKNLTPTEVYATFLSGPAQWKREKVNDCTVGKLHAHLQPRLEVCLAGELNRVLGDWVKWDVHRLAERRRKAIEAAEHDAAGGRVDGERPQRPRTPRGDRPSPAAFFRPPPRT